MDWMNWVCLFAFAVIFYYAVTRDPNTMGDDE